MSRTSTIDPHYAMTTPPTSSNPGAPRSLRWFVPALALVVATSSCDRHDGATLVTDFHGNGAASAGLDGGGAATLRLTRVSHNGGRCLPHRAEVLDASGNPTGLHAELRSLNDIRHYVTAASPVLPTPVLPATPTLPNGRAGNHFVAAEFTTALDPTSIFAVPSSTQLARAIRLTSRDPITGAEQTVPTRVLVGGVTAVDRGQGPQLERWLSYDEASRSVLAVVPEAEGFLNLSRARLREMTSPRTVVLIADTDDDLSTLETFPAGAALGLRVTSHLRGSGGQEIQETAFVTTSVGADSTAPMIAQAPQGGDMITPSNGAVDVDPNTEVTLGFSEPVQPLALGGLLGRDTPNVSNAVSLRFGPASQRTEMPLLVEPVSPFDLSAYRVVPAYAFPGAPSPGTTTPFNVVDLTLDQSFVMDLAGTLGAATHHSSFQVGPGVGFVNAPVLPDTVLAVRGGQSDGLSVVDLNGFGASSGSPISSPSFPLKGESRYPFNPNVRFQPALMPPIGTTTVDGGSAGAFTLTLDSNLQSVLASSPAMVSIDDAHVGHALDTTFRNAPPPFGCQAGGGNVCTLDGLKVINVVLDANGSTRPATGGQFGGLSPGYENLISWAPHPNPPPLAFPPACVSPFLAGVEPIDPGPGPGGAVNLLVPGDALGDATAMIPPSGILPFVQNSFFVGPTPDQSNVQNCNTYSVRQQIGHFVYIADRSANEVVVLNSNRMQVIDRLDVADPVQLAMSPDLRYLAVTSALHDAVVLIDIHPNSATFHQVEGIVQVGAGPQGIAWSPDNEDVFVCNELDGTVSVLSAFSRQVRKTLTAPSGHPFDVVAAPREVGFGLHRAVGYAFILCRGGQVDVFESGPNGVNGWGYDEIIGTLPFVFQAPKTLQLNPTESRGAFAVVHEGPFHPVTGLPGALGDGAISTVAVTAGTQGTITLVPNTMPQFRSITFDVVESLGASTGHLSGVPTDVAFDEQWNLGGLASIGTPFSAGSPLPANGKSNYRMNGSQQIVAAVMPRFLLAAVPGAGAIDVLEINAAGAPRVDVDIYLPGTQSIDAPGVRSLVGYWRQ